MRRHDGAGAAPAPRHVAELERNEARDVLLSCFVLPRLLPDQTNVASTRCAGYFSWSDTIAKHPKQSNCCTENRIRHVFPLSKMVHYHKCRWQKPAQKPLRLTLSAGKRKNEPRSRQTRPQGAKPQTTHTPPGEFFVVPLDTCFPFVLPMPQVASSDAGLHAEHAQPKFLRFLLVSNRKLVPVR